MHDQSQFLARAQVRFDSEQIDQMSIGYVAVDVAYGTKPGEPRRWLKKLDLFELSLVLFGMNDETSVDSVKLDAGKIYSPRDCERALRDAGVPRDLMELKSPPRIIPCAIPAHELFREIKSCERLERSA